MSRARRKRGWARRFGQWLLMLVAVGLLAACGAAPAARLAMPARPPAFAGIERATIAEDARLQAAVLTLDDDVRAWFVARVGSGGDAERLRRLIALFQEQGQLELRYSAAVTRPANDTFRWREGNCLSLSALFVAAAREVGLTAQFQDVELAPLWRREGDVFVAERHINAVVQLAGGPVVIDFLAGQEAAAVAVRPIADRGMEAQFFNNVGVEYLGRGDFATAYRFFERALAADAGIAYLWTNLGVALARNHQPEAAEQAYRQALHLDPADTIALSNLAASLEARGEGELASGLATRVAALRDSNPYYHFWLAEQQAAERPAAALARVRRALRLQPQEPAFYLLEAKLLAQQGDRAAAELSLAEALRRAPDAAARQRYTDDFHAAGTR